MLAGANGALIGDEYIQYGTVVSLGSNQYRLSHLLRGQRGTDAFWEMHAIGERAVLDNGGIHRFALPSDFTTGLILLKAVGDGQTHTDVTTATTVRVYGRETLEYAGCNLAGTRDGSNNLTLTWRRRARKHGDDDWMDGASLPLDTILERYQVFPLSSAGTAITAITQAEQAVVTAAGHGLAVGDLAYTTGILGMLALNGQIATVTAVAGNNVTLDVSTTRFNPWTSGGTIRKPTRTISVTAETASYLAATATTDSLPPAGPVTFVAVALGDDGRRGYPLIGAI
ncbi:MAG: hypothetical protein H0U60_13280 [Blastocatellia bacterium]|nr:hypothetical protein [Blastocatellia bacterium]